MANRISWVILPLLLMGCDRQAGTTAEVGAGAGNALEMAARERGIVHANMAMPTGVFERTMMFDQIRLLQKLEHQVQQEVQAAIGVPVRASFVEPQTFRGLTDRVLDQRDT